MITCAREKELTELLRRGHWPEACQPDLRDHVASCHACSDLILVSEGFQSARTRTAPQSLVSSGAIWWRAQLRRRNAAIERIKRPILGAQIFALAIALILAVGVVGWQLRRGINLTAWAGEMLRALHLSALLPTSNPASEGGAWLLVPLLATLALLSGVIVYLASEKH
jgi:hypothetical protein